MSSRPSPARCQVIESGAGTSAGHWRAVGILAWGMAVVLSRTHYAPRAPPPRARSGEQLLHRDLDPPPRGLVAAHRVGGLSGMADREQALHGVAQKARGSPVAVAIVPARWAVVVAHGHVDLQPAAGARQRDVEQAALLGDALLACGVHVGGDVFVVGSDQGGCLPLKALGGVDRAEDQVVLVEARRAA